MIFGDDCDSSVASDAEPVTSTALGTIPLCYEMAAGIDCFIFSQNQVHHHQHYVLYLF